MERTNRTFINQADNEIFALYHNPIQGHYKLISDGSAKHAPGTTIENFYSCSYSETIIKINNSKIVKLSNGQFYNLKDNETVTHRKTQESQRFSKVK
jgi:hypothetical protein